MPHFSYLFQLVLLLLVRVVCVESCLCVLAVLERAALVTGVELARRDIGQDGLGHALGEGVGPGEAAVQCAAQLGLQQGQGGAGQWRHLARPRYISCSAGGRDAPADH